MSLEIGERRRMERELRTMQDRYRSLVENMPGIGYVWDIHPGAHRRDLSYVSPRVREILGYDPDGWEPCDRVHPHDQASVAEAVDRARRRARRSSWSTGSWRTTGASSARSRHPDHAIDAGDPGSFQGMMLDITVARRRSGPRRPRIVSARSRNAVPLSHTRAS